MKQLKRPRISLRTALILLTVVGVGCGLIARWLASAERQRAALSQLSAQGIRHRYDFGADKSRLPRMEPRVPKWLISLVGIDAFYSVGDVDIAEAPRDPSVIAYLRDLDPRRVTAYAGDNGDAILEIVAHKPSVTHLGLYTGVTDAGLAHLAEMPQLVELRLHSETLTGRGLSKLKAPLETLSVDSPVFSDEGLRHVGRFHNLRELSLRSEAVTDAGLRHLSELAKLRGLMLTLPLVTDDGLQSIQSSRGIRELYLAGPRIGAQDLSWLAALPNVIHLILTCGVNDATLPEIGRLKRLEVLHLEGPVQATDAGMGQLRNMHSLQYLLVPPQLFTDESLPAVGEMTSLQVLSLANSTVTDAGLSHLIKMKSLGGLSLENTKLTDEGLRTLARLPHLNDLDLKGCEITPEGLNHLSELSTLRNLTLGGPKLDSRALEVLRELKQLQYIDLRECPVGDEILPILLSLPNLSTTHLPPDRISPGVLQQIKAANEAIQGIQ